MKNVKNMIERPRETGRAEKVGGVMRITGDEEDKFKGDLQ